MPMLPPRKVPRKVQGKNRKKFPKGHFSTRDLAMLMDRQKVSLSRVMCSTNELVTSVWPSAHKLLERMERLVQKWERLRMDTNDDRALVASRKKA